MNAIRQDCMLKYLFVFTLFATVSCVLFFVSPAFADEINSNKPYYYTVRIWSGNMGTIDGSKGYKEIKYYPNSENVSDYYFNPNDK